MNQAGSALAGPDLNVPMNPTEYFTDAGLRALIRDPRSVRVWPEQRMPSFGESARAAQEQARLPAELPCKRRYISSISYHDDLRVGDCYGRLSCWHLVAGIRHYTNKICRDFHL